MLHTSDTWRTWWIFSQALKSVHWKIYTELNWVGLFLIVHQHISVWKVSVMGACSQKRKCMAWLQGCDSREGNLINLHVFGVAVISSLLFSNPRWVTQTLISKLSCLQYNSRLLPVAVESIIWLSALFAFFLYGNWNLQKDTNSFQQQLHKIELHSKHDVILGTKITLSVSWSYLVANNNNWRCPLLKFQQPVRECSVKWPKKNRN